MKNTIATLALIAATATSVSANTMNNGGVIGSPKDFTWEGVATLPDRCEFHEGNTNGEMKLQEDELTWLVTVPAQIGLRVRGLTNVWVQNDGQFVGSNGHIVPAVVEYYGDPADAVQGIGASYYTYSNETRKIGMGPAAPIAVDIVKMDVSSKDDDMYLTLGGTAKAADNNAKFRSGERYKVVHTITCID
jgi:hypothetical protein